MGEAIGGSINVGMLVAAGFSDLLRPVYPLFLFLCVVTAFSLRKTPFALKLYGVLLLVFYFLSSISVLAGAVDEFFFRIEYMSAFFKTIEGLLCVWMFWAGACLFKDWIRGLNPEGGPFTIDLSEISGLAVEDQRFQWQVSVLGKSFLYSMGGIFFGMIIASGQPHEAVFNMIYYSLVHSNRYYILSLIIYQMVLTLPFSAVIWLFGSVRGRKILAHWAQEQPTKLRIICSAVCLASPIAYASVILFKVFANS